MSRRGIARSVAAIVGVLLVATACTTTAGDAEGWLALESVEQQFIEAAAASDQAASEAQRAVRARRSVESVTSLLRDEAEGIVEDLQLVAAETAAVEAAVEDALSTDSAVPADAPVAAPPLPDSGDLLVFRADEPTGEQELFTLDVATGRVNQLTESGDGFSVGFSAPVSLDGDFIAYSLTEVSLAEDPLTEDPLTEDKVLTDIVVAGLDGSGPVVVATREGAPSAVEWSPYGDLIFNDTEAGLDVISIVDPATGDQELLAVADQDAAFLVGMSGEHLIYADVGGESDKIVRFDLQPRERIDEFELGAVASAFLNERGSIIVMGPGRPTEDETRTVADMALISLGTSRIFAATIAEIENGLGGATLSPDGRRVAFTTGTQSGRSDLQIVDITRAFDPQLAAPDLNFGQVDQFRWSPSSEALYFSHSDGRRNPTPMLHVATLDGEVTPLGLEGWPVAVVER